MQKKFEAEQILPFYLCVRSISPERPPHTHIQSHYLPEDTVWSETCLNKFYI